MDMLPLEAYALPAALGIGLAAATGLRVFVPLLVLGLAARAGYVPVSESFAWVAAAPALLMLAVAAFIETAAYYVPGLDNLLDALAGPAAVIAGITISAAAMGDLTPMVKWTLAIIAGGGAAGLAQGVTTLIRGASTVTTAGLGNPLVATVEFAGALGVSVLAIFAPWIALAVAALLCILAFRLARRIVKRRRTSC